jgi:hypothetical protein
MGGPKECLEGAGLLSHPGVNHRLILNIFFLRSASIFNKGECMEEQYKDAAIVVTIAPSVMGLRWRSSCAVKFLKDGREAVEYLELSLDYDTAEQAKRAGLVFSKLWIDAGKPESLTT